MVELQVSPSVVSFCQVCAVLTFVTMGKVSTTDPGILPRRVGPQDSLPKGRRWARAVHRYSRHCKSYMPAGAAFDDECGVVVDGYDHTCPFIGTAVGRKNAGIFMVFVCVSYLSAVISSGFVVLHVWQRYKCGYRYEDIMALQEQLRQHQRAGPLQQHMSSVAEGRVPAYSRAAATNFTLQQDAGLGCNWQGSWFSIKPRMEIDIK